jgi:hypothetical protein
MPTTFLKSNEIKIKIPGRRSSGIIITVLATEHRYECTVGVFIAALTQQQARIIQ